MLNRWFSVWEEQSRAATQTAVRWHWRLASLYENFARVTTSV